MKKTTVILSLALSLFIGACGNSNTDTTTEMPDSGYKPRTDTVNSAPITTDSMPTGAVRADSIYNGQTGVSGVQDANNSNKKDSAGNK